jgi:hypothetical protein
MIKSITIRDKNKIVLVKIIHRKNGVIDGLLHNSCTGLDIEIRDEKNDKIDMWRVKDDNNQWDNLFDEGKK